MAQTVLVLLAHNDDEFFISAHIRGYALLGWQVYVAFTCFGSAYGVSHGVRAEESLQVLSKLGVPKERVLFIGYELGVKDGSVFHHLEALRTAFLGQMINIQVNRLVTMAWEGGHIDHDATHLLGVVLAMNWGISANLFEFPAYQGFGLPGPFYRVAKLIPRGTETRHRRLGFFEAFFYLSLSCYYRSQRKTFLGLLPDTIYRWMIRREQQCRRVGSWNYLVRPHEGKLFYERRFKVEFQEFTDGVRGFIVAHQLSGNDLNTGRVS